MLVFENVGKIQTHHHPGEGVRQRRRILIADMEGSS
jgi:hypothetical protein